MWVKQWATGLLGKPGAIILDTETTGLEGYDEVVAVAAIDTAGNVLLDTLVRPAQATVSLGAYAVHGIGTKALAAAPTFAELADEFLASLEGRKHIIGYNVSFDARLLHQSFAACGPAGLALLAWHRSREWHDVMEPYAKHWAASRNRYHARWQKLDVACRQQGIVMDDIPVRAHSALGDCQRVLALLERLAGAK